MENLTLLNILIMSARFLIPFTIFKWRFKGAVAAMLADAFDVMLMEKFGHGIWTGTNYHLFDKFFDTYYLFFEFVVVWKFWENKLARKVGISLFGMRMFGFLMFEITGIRQMFFFFPNIFEFFYLGYEFLRKYFPKYVLDKKRILILFLVVGIPNIIKEYFMHFLEFETWHFFRDHLFWWIY